MKFIHCADLHLDSPFLGLRGTPKEILDPIYHATFQAFTNIVDDALRLQVDFICITGDIYDRDQHSVAAEVFFNQQCARLAQQQIAVYLSYGNHDYQTVQASSPLPENVHVFGNHVETYTHTTAEGQHVAITGFSYQNRWIHEDMMSQYPNRQATVDWQIGMLHGSMDGVSSQHAHYAPFTLDELLAKHYDYWALGHIHKRQVLHQQPPVIYSGNTQGRQRTETGEKGYYLVTGDQNQLVAQFHPVAPIIWANVEIPVTATTTSSSFSEMVTSQAESLRLPEHLILLGVTAKVDETADPNLVIQLENQALLKRLQSQVGRWADGYWPVKLILNRRDDGQQLTGIDQSFWHTAEQQVFDPEAMTKLADKLTSYPFIDAMLRDETIIADIKQRTTALIQEQTQGAVDHEN